MPSVLRRFARIPRELIIVLSVVACIHAVFLFGTSIILNEFGGSIHSTVTQQDAAEFFSLGQSLIGDGNFFVHGIRIPETFRTIGYPAVIAGIFSLTGGSTYVPQLAPPSWGDAFYVTIGFLSLLGVATSGLILGIAQRIGVPNRLALAAGIVSGMSPAALLLPLTGMGSDAIFVFLIAVSLYLVLLFPTTDSPGRIAASIGALLGAATLTRPVGQYFAILFILGLPLFYTLRTHVRFRDSLVYSGIVFGSFLVIISPWIVRNYYVAGQASISSISVYSFANYNIPLFMSFHKGIPMDESQKKILDSIGNPPDRIYRSFAYTDALREINASFVAEYWRPYALFHVIKAIPFFLGSGVDVVYATIGTETQWRFRVPFLPHTDDNLSTLVYRGEWSEAAQTLVRFWPATIERLSWATLFGLVLVSPFLAATPLARRFGIFAIVVIGTAAFLASPVAQPRYRIPIEPFVWTLGPLAAYELWRRARLQRFRMTATKETPAGNVQ